MISIKKELIGFFNKKTKKKISPKTDLISTEIIDSFGLIETVEFIEKKLLLKCPVDKINKINFNSVDLIIKFLKKYNKIT